MLTSGWQLVKKALKEFDADNCSLLAAALAYYALVSLVPLLMLGISVVGFVLGSSDAAVDRVLNFAMTVMPKATGDVYALVRSLIQSKGIVSGIGLLGLLWSGSQMFLLLEQAMDIAWDSPRPSGWWRGWWQSHIRAIGMVLAMGLFLALSFGMTFMVSVIEGFRIPILGLHPSQLPFIWPLVGFLLPLVLTVSMFTALYKFTPNRKVLWESAFAGGILAGLLFEAAKVGFAYYVANIGHFDKVYGSVAGLIGFVVWSYYAAHVVLFGAEFASEYDEQILGRKRQKRDASLILLHHR